MEQSFWSNSTVAQLGLTRVEIVFRFETVVVSENGANVPCYRVWLSYRNDLSKLFTVTLSPWKDEVVKQWGSAFPMVLRQLVEGSSLPADNPGCCGITLMHDAEFGGLSFYVDLASAPKANIPTAVHLMMRLASDAQFKAHLLDAVSEMKEERSATRLKIIGLENDVKCLKTALEQKERLCAWQEKELDHRRRLCETVFSQRPVEKHEVAQILDCEDATCILPKCEDDSCSHSKASPTAEDDDLVEIEGNEDDDEAVDADGKSPTPAPTLSPKPSNNDLLLGIATYLFCSLCPEKVSLPDSDQMTQHFIREHVDDEKRQCRACPEELPKSSNDLLSHVKVHTNRIYVCKFCGKKGRKNYLKSHIRVHSGENPFVCTVCKRTFSDSSTLRRHQTVHTGEKKHSCPICGRNMSRKDNVRVHLKSHHKNTGAGKSSEPPAVRLEEP
ncbi:hypothetical protein QR680_009683 [Steinernema hermaphroditum]|uniref:C2H2-type domain-containing protein n=1 Tax=Steinernema hermaphroditum TaxID=289476 RepID=A0AA39IMM8_9BILA|nr:hypothetical protein QR680_009683 [Steinernema hermaphroditum]